MELKTNLYGNDEELVYMVRENSEEAKDMLYKKYSGMIHKEINRVKRSAYALGVDMQDLMQEALLGFSGAINSYDEMEEAVFSTYATMCVRRKLINYIDKYSTAKNFSMKSALSLDMNLRGKNDEYLYYLRELDGREPLNKVITDESLLEVGDRFGKVLSEEEKKIMKYSIEGKKPEEIANILGVPVKNIYNHLYRARKKIRVD